MSDAIQTLIKARRVSTPTLAVATADQPAFIAAVGDATNGSPRVRWDIVSGFAGLNDMGKQVVAALDDQERTCEDPAAAIRISLRFPGSTENDDGKSPGTILFVLNAQRYFTSAQVVQSIMNIREPYKANMRTLVLLGPDFDLPAELQSEVFLLHDRLPNDTELEDIFRRVHSIIEKPSGKKPASEPPTDELVASAVDAGRGLSAFAFEQVVFMSIIRENDDVPAEVDIEALWERKRTVINSTRGLTIRKARKTAKLRGLKSALAYLSKLGKARLVVVLDEIEKAMAGSVGSGARFNSTGSDRLKVILTNMEEQESTGLILAGPNGTGKSMLAEHLGDHFGCPTIHIDLPAMDQELVGQSASNIRHAMDVIYSVGGEHVFWVATSNGLAEMPPELLRRFAEGVMLVDLPDGEERPAIWESQKEHYGIDAGEKIPGDDGWSGADIRDTCRRFATGDFESLVEAGLWTVPCARRSAGQIEACRRNADGKYLSASKPGVYRYKDPGEVLIGSARDIES